MPVVDRPTRESDWEDPDLWEADHAVIARAIEQIKRRFIEERVNGFNHPITGVYYPPAPREEVEARWRAHAPEWEKDIGEFHPPAVRKLGTYRFNAARARSKHAEMDEPSLRRGESMVSYICGKSIQS